MVTNALSSQAIELSAKRSDRDPTAATTNIETTNRFADQVLTRPDPIAHGEHGD